MNEEDIPTRFYYNIHDVCFYYPDLKDDGEFNIKCIIEDLHATLERDVGYFACSKYDDVIIEDLYIKVGIMVDTENIAKKIYDLISYILYHLFNKNNFFKQVLKEILPIYIYILGYGYCKKILLKM